MNTLQNQHVLVLGLGISGLAMARWCVHAGARVSVADTRAVPPRLAALQQTLPGVEFIHAATLDAPLLTHGAFGAIFKSPGLSLPEVAPLRRAAPDIPWGGELTLFTQALVQLREARAYQPQLLAVTGTNGKTTVTSLTGQLLRQAGKTVAVAGNIGPSLLDTLLEHWTANTLPQVWVLELSSFQLQDDMALAPTAATVLNISEDHLDWHGEPGQDSAQAMQAYVAAKARIFGAHGLMVLNREDPQVMAMLPRPARHAPPRAYLTFGADLPKRPGDFGLEQANGMLWLVRAMPTDGPPPTHRSAHKPAPEPHPELHLQRLMPADALRIHGRHNAVNALAALALAGAAGALLGPLLQGLRQYRGEPHRMASLGVLDGVEYFDDSKGTNVGATVAALQGLGTQRRLVLILGGIGKGQNFRPLAAPVAQYARAVVLIGRAAPLLRAALADTGVALSDAADMAQAVAQARAQAHAGDAVLLSPACASFDMFDDYQHRARVFVAAVNELARAAGVSLEVAA